VHVNNERRLQKAKTESRTSTAGHIREKEDGNFYSVFCTQQAPASLASKKLADNCHIWGFFFQTTNTYVNLSSQGDMRVESMVIWNY